LPPAGARLVHAREAGLLESAIAPIATKSLKQQIAVKSVLEQKIPHNWVA